MSQVSLSCSFYSCLPELHFKNEAVKWASRAFAIIAGLAALAAIGVGAASFSNVLLLETYQMGLIMIGLGGTFLIGTIVSAIVILKGRKHEIETPKEQTTEQFKPETLAAARLCSKKILILVADVGTLPQWKKALDGLVELKDRIFTQVGCEPPTWEIIEFNSIEYATEKRSKIIAENPIPIMFQIFPGFRFDDHYSDPVNKMKEWFGKNKCAYMIYDSCVKETGDPNFIQKNRFIRLKEPDEKSRDAYKEGGIKEDGTRKIVSSIMPSEEAFIRIQTMAAEIEAAQKA